MILFYAKIITITLILIYKLLIVRRDKIEYKFIEFGIPKENTKRILPINIHRYCPK